MTGRREMMYFEMIKGLEKTSGFYSRQIRRFDNKTK
jgi:hypothetical protein